jgi:hypothetical protein
MHKNFDDTFEKVGGTGCTTAAGPKQEAGQSFHLVYCSTTAVRASPHGTGLSRK